MVPFEYLRPVIFANLLRSRNKGHAKILGFTVVNLVLRDFVTCCKYLLANPGVCRCVSVRILFLQWRHGHLGDVWRLKVKSRV